MLNSTSRDAGLYILNSFEANGSKRSRRTLVSATVHPKEKSQSSGFQIPASRFRILGCSPYKEVKPNDNKKYQALATLLRFPGNVP